VVAIGPSVLIDVTYWNAQVVQRSNCMPYLLVVGGLAPCCNVLNIRSS
jgi:hypothetical protein